MDTIDIVEIIGLGVVVAANPLPVVGQLTLVTREGGRPTAVALASGWAGALMVVLGLLATGMAAVIGASVGFEADGSMRAGAEGGSWFPIVLGVALIVLGVLSWARKPRVTPSPLMKTLDSLTPARAVALGAGLALLKPKSIAALLAAGAIVGAEGRPLLSSAILVLLVTGVGSLGVVVPLILAVVGGPRIVGALRTAQRTMERHSSHITSGLVIAVGLVVLAFGLAEPPW
ncbi:threonine/homoserine/homoserine lactone efflux protein [Microbacterium proteolyticum]|uniref:Threonine/homoserine/homoserine lactone efflux protein n=1 Tax=Microbacterium proteolyticum TaxID=1572644 RepID=A0A7W5CIL5_9MICO|nr:GAP family protein [Microbacterium proteolyticum]MBB3157860.1 threonine/homoserine/homoserine lactone efflux protein [Microbacterium proteolyticum]